MSPWTRHSATTAETRQGSGVEPETPQAHRRGRTRDAILTAALELYTREGYGAVTMRAIATQLGFSAPAIYNYFLSKEEIFVALQKIGLRTLREACLKPLSGDALEDLRSIYVSYYEFAMAQPAYFTLLYVDPSAPLIPSPEESDDLLLMRDETQARMQRCIDGGVFPAGTPAARATQLFWGAVHGAAVLRQVDARSPGLEFDQIALHGLDLAIAAMRAGLLPAEGSPPTR